MKSKSFIAVDLFAGAGGFSLAAIQSGFSIDFAIENDRHAAKTYKENILQLPGATKACIFNQSILEYDPDELKLERFSRKSCDLLLGGPPCQGFSAHRILNAGVNDPRNKLIMAYFDFVRSLRPRVFLMENVPGILWDRHKDYIEKFYEEGRKAGYKILDPIVLDARDFGVPQRRKRVFILGLRDSEDANGLVWPPHSTHCSPLNNEVNKLPWVNCKDSFRRAPKGDINNVHMKHGPELLEAFKRTPENGGSRKDSGRILACHRDHDGHKDVYGRIDPSQPAPTMTTACINPSKGRFVHPTQHHGITLRQAARIQTFPDDFIFSGGLMASGKQIGNAVPVELGRVLIQHIKESILVKSKKIKKPTRTNSQTMDVECV
ncbi:DNA cytosine methyltransferase [Gilvimarinus polysaccharolyticus]|uniref:DNA cytosine methyltransferase n=1 Tax=Gilvimarinus polysaccharolyticus TaxID=863921 RepID=UPI0006732025|nr:DNA cytosine methyltransferase [Gilvimarinus polysaccharolyticus]